MDINHWTLNYFPCQAELPSVRTPGVEGELVSLLTVMLAQAINQQDRSAAAQLRETLRCLSQFDQVGGGGCP